MTAEDPDRKMAGKSLPARTLASFLWLLASEKVKNPQFFKTSYRKTLTSRQRCAIMTSQQGSQNGRRGFCPLEELGDGILEARFCVQTQTGWLCLVLSGDKKRGAGSERRNITGRCLKSSPNFWFLGALSLRLLVPSFWSLKVEFCNQETGGI